MPRKVVLVSLIGLSLIVAGCSKKEKITGDFTPPVINNVKADNISGTRATITWNTDEQAFSIVHFGVFSTYGTKMMQTQNLTTNHSITLIQLVPASTYHFCVEARDIDGNASLSQDYTFVTSLSTTTIYSTEVTYPFYVYKDYFDNDNHFIPSGWMGDAEGGTEYVGFNDNCSTTNPYSGISCIEISYKKTGNKKWAGIYWQEPGNNWGTEPDAGYDLSMAKKITFWARGKNGGERGEFKVGGIGDPQYGIQPYPDSLIPAKSTGEIILTTTWTKYEIDLVGLPLTYVIGGFCWVATASDNPTGMVFYLDDIRFE